MEDHLKTLVGFYPVSTHQDAVLSLLQYAKEHFDRAGLHTELLTYDGVHNLYASTTGKKHTKILLQSHVDVVPGGNAFRATDDRYEGRGTFDMLFAVACYMRLVDELGSELMKLDIGIFLSGDEELGGNKGVEALLNDGYTADICILPDAGDGYGKLSTGAKGLHELKVRINGQSHHGSRPWEGDGAAIKLAHFLTEAEAIFDTSDHDNSTMTVATLAAGDAGNRGPAYADAGLDIRYKNKADLARIQHALQALLEKYNGAIIETLEGDDYQLDMTNPLVRQFLEMYEEQVGKSIQFITAPGSSDARFLTPRGIPALMWRPDGFGAHGDNEWVSRSSLDAFYTLLKNYTRKIAMEK